MHVCGTLLHNSNPLYYNYQSSSWNHRADLIWWWLILYWVTINEVKITCNPFISRGLFCPLESSLKNKLLQFYTETFLYTRKHNVYFTSLLEMIQRHGFLPCLNFLHFLPHTTVMNLKFSNSGLTGPYFFYKTGPLEIKRGSANIIQVITYMAPTRIFKGTMVHNWYS